MSAMPSLSSWNELRVDWIVMPKFMNAELEAIRDNLDCGHCGCKFVGSDSQAWKVKYEKRTVYCSTVCRRSAVNKKLRKDAVLYGPCPVCGKMFESRYKKMFCNMDCYTKSDQFRAMITENRMPEDPVRLAEIRAKTAEKLRKGKDVPCLECGKMFYQKRQTDNRLPKKFCNKSCYRAYLSKRFDRWLANPEGMALPQCYDEFLDREILKCVVEGCDWEGQSLSAHMNLWHGVNAPEFKRAAGFNLSTGVIARPLAEVLRKRENVGVAVNLDCDETRLSFARLGRETMKDSPRLYFSLEGKEHAKKARLLLGAGPHRTCAECGHIFQQSTPFGKALYCSVECRTIAYAKKRKAV
jgi:hypothetical protein